MQIGTLSGNGERWKPHGNASTKYTIVSTLNQVAFYVEYKVTLDESIKVRHGRISNGLYPIKFQLHIVAVHASAVLVHVCFTWL